MAKIKVKVETFASESVVDEIVQRANAATPAGVNPHAATVIRDAAGKVVEVQVGLPTDVATADLENAKDAISGNPGVSKAMAFPAINTEGFETLGLTDYQDLSNTLIDLQGVKADLQTYTSAKIEATSAAEALTGSKSLAFINPDATSSSYDYMSSGLTISAVNNELTLIEGLKLSMKVQLGAVYNTVTSGQGGSTYSVFRIQTPWGMLESANEGTWKMVVANQIVDTGLAVMDLVHLDVELSAEGVATIKELISGTTMTLDYGYPVPASAFTFSFLSQENYASPEVRAVRPFIIDDVAVGITSGS